MDSLIEELTDAAVEGIEKAAGEAAKAAALASIDREAKALAEAAKWQSAYSQEKRGKIAAAVIVGLACLFGGYLLGGLK